MHSSIQNEPLYVSSLVDFVISILLSLAGILINWKHLRNMEEDEKMRSPGETPSLINDVMKTYTKVIMVLTPYYIFLNWILNEDLDFPEWFQYAVCYDQYLAHFSIIYYAFNSFVIATMRYTFIVHQNRVLVFGKEKAKSMFYHGSYTIPIAIAFLNAFTNPMPQSMQNSAQLLCNAFHRDSLNITCGDSNGIRDECSPILSLTHYYVPLEVTKYVGAFVKLLFIIILLNVVEGSLYFKTFRSIKR